MCKKIFRNLIVYGMIVNFLTFGFIQSASAAMIGTQTAVVMQDRAARMERIDAALAREDVRAQIVAMGVDPAAAQARVAALTDEELAQLEGQLDQLPAAGGVIGVIGVVFVVLLILELVGVTDIFKKI